MEKTKYARLETGDIILKRGRGFGRLINLYTNSRYSHAGIVHRAPFVYHATLRGIRSNHVSKFKPCDIYRLKSELSATQREFMLSFLTAVFKDDYSYDLSQFFGYIYASIFGGENKFNSPKEYICSELPYRAYHSMQIDLLPERQRGDARPVDLANSKLLSKKEELR